VIHVVPTNPTAGILSNSGIKCVTFKLKYKIVCDTIQSSYFSRRDTQEKKDEAKKPSSTSNKPDNKRPQRDVTGTAQPQKQGEAQPTSSSGVKKDEKHQ
jgi:hypothetical protein